MKHGFLHFTIDLEIPPIGLSAENRRRLGEIKKHTRNADLTDVDNALVAEVCTHLEALQQTLRRARPGQDKDD